MLKYRIISSIILVPIVVLGIFYLPTNYFAILCGFVFTFAIYEWSKLICNGNKNQAIIAVVLYGIITALLLYLQWFSTIWIIMIAVIWWFLACVWLFFSEFGKQTIYSNKALKFIAGIFIIIPAWQALVWLHQVQLSYLLILFLTVWASDVGGYVIGKCFGKHKLVPKISPGKTIEGFLGSLLIGLLLIVICQLWIDSISFSQALTIGFFVIMAAIIGDLFESMIKRQAGIKDSGYLIPGHGGFLDRLDSLFAAAPIFAASIYFFVL